MVELKRDSVLGSYSRVSSLDHHHHQHHQHQHHPQLASSGSSPKSAAAAAVAAALTSPWKLKNFLVVASLALALPIIFTRLLFFSGPTPAPAASSIESQSLDLADQPQEPQQSDIAAAAAAPPPPPPPPDLTSFIDFSVGGCNIWKGDWIPNPSGPAYNNSTCRFIQEHQNCLKNGRPDHGYLFWRWKPHDCDLPLFDARLYLTLVTGKSWAFIGDSIARNHFQSFLCSLAQVEMPENLYKDDLDRNVRWYFRTFNFTLSIVWAPFLVQGTEDEAEGFAQGIEKLHLDRADESWASALHSYDYIVLSSGQWYLKTSVYFMEGKVIGGHNSYSLNLTELGFYYGYRVALRTVFDHLIAAEYKGVVFFRTFTPDHFENGRWDNGGNCTRTLPFASSSMALQGMTAEMYKIQLEELGRTLQKRSSELSFELRIADTIHASLLRPDAHPGPYRNFQPFAHDVHAKVQNDCLHWCLPGAIDTWSAMLLQSLRHLRPPLPPV